MLTREISAAALGLCSALSWGASDFSGGMATKKLNVVIVIIWTQVVGAAALSAVALLLGETMPSRTDLILSCLAGIAEAFGLCFLFKGLAEGRMGLVAPVSGVLAALAPIAAAALTQGPPPGLTLLGFAAALVAVWLLASEKGAPGLSLAALRMPVLAGLGFGLYLALIGLGDNEQMLWELVAARLAALVFLLSVLPFSPGGRARPGKLWPFVLMAGLFDAGGNAFFGLGVQVGRMDVAGVLGALYPGATVLLAVIFLKERLLKRHWAGLTAALAALALISH
ncbi:MAG: EamA family transporter [Pseudomonadota bacterium]